MLKLVIVASQRLPVLGLGLREMFVQARPPDA